MKKKTKFALDLESDCESLTCSGWLFNCSSPLVSVSEPPPIVAQLSASGVMRHVLALIDGIAIACSEAVLASALENDPPLRASPFFALLNEIDSSILAAPIMDCRSDLEQPYHM